MDSTTEQWKMIYGNISLIQASTVTIILFRVSTNVRNCHEFSLYWKQDKYSNHTNSGKFVAGAVFCRELINGMKNH